MLWLFDKRREFLVQEYIPEFGAMNHEDLLDFERREEDENVTNRRKKPGSIREQELKRLQGR